VVPAELSGDFSRKPTVVAQLAERETWQAYAHNGAATVVEGFREIALKQAAKLDGRVTPVARL
jgi:hypothetical protein